MVTAKVAIATKIVENDGQRSLLVENDDQGCDSDGYSIIIAM